MFTLSDQPYIFLKEGTERRQGSDATRNNFMAAILVSQMIKTSLGPKGMDKMLVDSFSNVTVSNDGATILKELEVQHPAARLMVDTSKTQDKMVGDGTTSVVVVAGELLGKAMELMGKGVHPTVIIDGYRDAEQKAIEILDEIAIEVDPKGLEILRKVATTSLASKLVSGFSEHIVELAVDAILQVTEEGDSGYEVDLDMVKITKKPGGALRDTALIRGIIVDKEVVHENMPKKVKNAKIGLLNEGMEVHKTEFDAKIDVESPEAMQSYLDMEKELREEMVDKVKSLGINVLICQKGIDDVVQQFMVREGILAIRRLMKKEIEAVAKATGAEIVNTIEELTEEATGYAANVEERKIGEDKMVFIEGCRNPKAVSILIRGGTEQITDEADRSIHDALFVVKDVVESPKIVAGGGAPEAEIARRIREYNEGLVGRERLTVAKFAEAIEVVPIALAENAGMDPIDAISEVQSRHARGETWVGINSLEGKVSDMADLNVYEPLAVKAQSIKLAVEASTMLLRIDDVFATKPEPLPEEEM
ncbi:MAG: thermosome subunit beta [Candidatus Bathyarchaeota archaeon]|nr:thermosome subunit beta [Candidatus Bathyarchaeota archaeon]